MSELSLPADLLLRLKAAKRWVASTGAGVSAESGVPTFRDAQTGLWARFRPEQLATPEAFLADPPLVWKWYAWRREAVAAARPNAGHQALVALELMAPEFTLITQNVDGLHARAGSRTLLELHGNIQQTKCFDEGTLVPHWEERGEVPPRCPACGGMLRPNVVWFGESLPQQTLERAWKAAQECDLFLSIGTSTEVQPAASLPFVARAAGATLVEINPAPTPLSARADFILRGPAAVVLPQLVAAYGT
jgi:NAD-dependent deacetylase